MSVRAPSSTEALPPFTRRDLRALAMTSRELDRLVASGEVVQPFHGVYLDGRAADDPVMRARAMALVLPAGAAACHRTAAWLVGIDARGPGRHLDPLPLECVVPAGTTPPRRTGMTARAAALSPGDVVEVHGMPVTSATRTAVDLARYSPPHMGLAVLDAMAHAGLVAPTDLAARLAERPGERGVARARRLVELCEPATESFGESWLRLRAIDAGFPRPEPQIWVCGEDQQPLYRLDMGWRERRLAAEYDGEEFHSSPAHRDLDGRRRDHLAREFGWTVVGVGRGEVLGPRLDLERGLGHLLGMAPRIARRPW